MRQGVSDTVVIGGDEEGRVWRMVTGAAEGPFSL